MRLLLMLGLWAPMAAAAADKHIYWGDLHIHTSYSMDAYVLNNQAEPADAYHFAQGGEVTLSNGDRYRLPRPLDFAAVTDHGEYFGLIHVCRTEPERPYCKALAEAAGEDSRRGFMEFFLPLLLEQDKHCLVDDAACRKAESDLWQRTIHAAETANKPGQFTTFVASEWTASPGNLHWHRNLIYRNASVPPRPINSFDQPDQADLWRALRDQCTAAGACDVLAIPHNGNIGMGGTYNIEGHSAELLSLRAQFEKLVEIHQHKGASECYPGSGYSDEGCDFEIAMPVPIRNQLREQPRELTAAEQQQIASGYVRDTLARGLALRAAENINPFRYGFVGATDNHSARPGNVDEQNWFGALGQWDEDLEGQQAYPNYNPGGLTAIWAEKNTREALFSALKRREVYATSGPRIGLHFSQSFNTAGCVRSQQDSAVMGGVLGAHDDAQQPIFNVHALQDATPLARIDIIKLSVTDRGVAQQVTSFDAPEGRSDWCVSWRDDQYRKGDVALWYARVLQQPTQRWDGEQHIQERAWSSPIWSVEQV